LALPGSFPNKPFQYLSAGLAILSSVTGEMAALIRDNRIGVLYDGGNLQSLVAAITRLTSGPDLNEMKTRAVRIFEDQFEEQAIYRRYAEFVEELALSGTSSTSDLAVLHN
jgi:glycosyltransferase involved in cell wall biosynthesis